MSDGTKIAIVAAMEREISGLVQGWDWHWLEVPEGHFRAKCWVRGDVAAVAVGTGWERATFGTKVVIEAFQPKLVTSVGYTGSLSPGLVVGSLFVPAQVIGFAKPEVYETGTGKGLLATVAAVAGVAEKTELVKRFGAQAVDMEAAAVADVASAAGIRFVAVKAVSDAVDDRMDFLEPFVRPEGFRTAGFVAFVAIRPWLWGAVARLGSNSKKAAETLTKALREFARQPEEFLNQHALPGASLQSTAQQGGKN